MKNQSLNIKTVKNKLVAYGVAAKPYSLLIFVLFVASIYGFVFFKINSLSDSQPTDAEISSQVKALPVPHIDPKIVQQIESLQDNSVSVQSLFEEARNNPFNQ